MNPVLDIFNYPYVQQQAQQHHINQLVEVQKGWDYTSRSYG